MANIFLRCVRFCIVPLFSLVSPINHKDTFKAQRAVWGLRVVVGGLQLYFLPTGCSVQCVMEDQSLWPTGGLLQPLAEPHTNKWALGIQCSWNLIYKRQNPCGARPCHRWHMYNYALLSFQIINVAKIEIWEIQGLCSFENWNPLRLIRALTKHFYCSILTYWLLYLKVHYKSCMGEFLELLSRFLSPKEESIFHTSWRKLSL